MAATPNPIVLAINQATPVRTSDDWIVAGCPRPSMRYCRALTLQLLTAGATIKIGTQRPNGVGPNVSATVYNEVMNDANPSYTPGLATECNDIDMGDTYLFSDTDNAQVAIAPETT